MKKCKCCGAPIGKKKQKFYDYLVAYNFQSGTGRINIKRKEKISSLSDIESMEQLISETNGISKVAIVNYILMNSEDVVFIDYDEEGEDVDTN